MIILTCIKLSHDLLDPAGGGTRKNERGCVHMAKKRKVAKKAVKKTTKKRKAAKKSRR